MFLQGFCKKRCAERGFLCGEDYMLVVGCGQRDDTFPLPLFLRGL